MSTPISNDLIKELSALRREVSRLRQLETEVRLLIDGEATGKYRVVQMAVAGVDPKILLRSIRTLLDSNDR